MIKELKTEFDGIGEVKGYFFKQILRNKKSYLYEVVNKETDAKHYEVFRKKLHNIFDPKTKKKLSGQVVTYPKSKAFGVSAWTSRDFIKAVDTYESLT